MKTIIAISLLCLTLNNARACGIYGIPDANRVLATNRAVASSAVAALREMGPAGLDLLLQTHAGLMASQAPSDQWQRLRAALDAVGAQRDCHASRLFWHTSFDQAKAEARRTSKPILSLRLLGRLDEELSCAISRFFRTTLYANAAVSDYLRKHFVLHWQSVRPVPRITIDMGDGRQIRRTLTGNSIHYILDQSGGVVDALPGLYSPKAFLAGLQKAEHAALRVANLPSEQRHRILQEYHGTQLARISERWGLDLSQVLPPEELAPKTVSLSNGALRQDAHPAATAAMSLAVSKSGVELPLLRGVTRESLERATTDLLWAKIAALHQGDVALDANSIALIRAKTVTAADAMRLAFAKRMAEDPLLRTLRNLERSIAEDTVRNEYTFHARIHEWLMEHGTMLVDALNTRVYDELFLTPESDPWLGLAPADTFTALDNAGLVVSRAHETRGMESTQNE